MGLFEFKGTTKFCFALYYITEETIQSTAKHVAKTLQHAIHCITVNILQSTAAMSVLLNQQYIYIYSST